MQSTTARAARVDPVRMGCSASCRWTVLDRFRRILPEGVPHMNPTGREAAIMVASLPQTSGPTGPRAALKIRLKINYYLFQCLEADQGKKAVNCKKDPAQPKWCPISPAN
ncbi:hypothetical protein [Roseivivax sediminis]|uniref:hypothetical protein n=1 Tax=Roseivivax sediminis TaxID=936889 RepID=UPI00165EDAA8|nr:hypothetical protein [Roseivivax sediminis]